MLNKVPLRAWIIWAVIFASVIIVIQIVSDRSVDPQAIKFSEFREAVASGQIEAVQIKDLEVSGSFKAEYAKNHHKGQAAFKTVGPVGEDLQDALMAKEVEYTFVPNDENSIWQQMLVSFIPVLLIVVVLIFLMRQFQSGNGKAMTFGKSRAKLLNESQNKITFNDIAGIDEAKDELQEVVEFLKNPKKFTRLGGRIPKGVLLMGPPGTGKTLLARGVAGEAGVPFFSISGSDFVEMFVGVGASRVRDLFEQAKKQAPCIIFIDEIDAVGRHRGSGLGGGHDEREQTLNQLLVEMDGFESNDGVILVAATNRPDVLDPALLRPGRFDRRVMVPPPDVRGREAILKIHTRRVPLNREDVDLSRVAKGTPGFSGADLENLVNEAALNAARLGKDRVGGIDFEDARDKVLMGPERKSAVIGDEERRLTAYHESGHALVAMMLDDTDPIHKVTIIPRGRAMGVMQQRPNEDRYGYRRSFVLQRIAVAMGGRAAEEVVFGEITTGAGNDIQQATRLARKMVCEWGMSDSIGPLDFSSEPSASPFGQGGGYTPQPYSEAVARDIDDEVRRIVTEQYNLAVQLLRDNIALLDLMGAALLEFEVLDHEEIELIMEHGDLQPLRDLQRRRSRTEEQQQEKRVPKTGFTSKLKDPTTGLGELPPDLDLTPSA